MPPTPISGVRASAEDMATNFYANPHSLSAAGIRASNTVEDARQDVLNDLFDLSDDSGWELVFTSGTTASLQLAVQSFDFASSSQLVHLLESHTSVVGLRGLARARGVNHATVTEQVLGQRSWSSDDLAVVPLQCNATGRKYNNLLDKLCLSSPRPSIMVDAAAYLSSNRLKLPSASQEGYDRAPDLIAFSLYKVYGAPTGLGGLLVKSSSAYKLSAKPYYGGGTVSVLLPDSGLQIPRASSLPARLEDGTVNVHGIVALRHAMRACNRTLGIWDKQAAHLRSLAHQLHTSLARIKHANGRPVVHVLSSSHDAEHWASHASDARVSLQDDQGPTAAFILFSSTGARVPVAEFARLASLANVHIRVGRHCNAGVAVSHTLRSQDQAGPATDQQIKQAEAHLWKIYEQGAGCETAAQAVVDAPESCAMKPNKSVSDSFHGKTPAAEPDEDDPAASIRASLSVWNTTSDIDELVEFIKLYFVDHTKPVPIVAAETQAVPCPQAESPLVLKMVTLYPIKSCAGQELPVDPIAWPLTPSGLLHDREWCIIDLDTGRAISQKREPRMATIRPFVDRAKQVLEVRLPRIHSASRGRQDPVPYNTPIGEAPCNLEDDEVLLIPFGQNALARQNLRVCTDDVLARVYDAPEVAGVFTRFLGRKATLARLTPDQAHRHTKLAVNNTKPDGIDGVVPAPAPILLANESPFLMLHQGALEAVSHWIEKDLASKGETPLSNLHWCNVARRFRANMVVGYPDLPTSSMARTASISSWDSDSSRSDASTDLTPAPSNTSEDCSQLQVSEAKAGVWCDLPGDELRRITVGGQTFASLGPCRRCHMVAIDQQTGRKLPQTLLSLSQRRRAPNGRVVFGTHLAWIPRSGSDHSLRVGMPVVAADDA